MSDWIEIIVLGIVQGISEFLPISSDGHLVIVNAIFEHFTQRHRADILERTVALHAGTLLAVLVVYGRDFFHAVWNDWKALALIVVGTIPAVIVGLVAERFFEEWLESPLLAGIGLIITGLILLWGTRRQRGELPYRQLTYPQAFAIGTMQAFAILPGVSRSGSTISTGLQVGLTRRDSARYSFLLSIPVVAGACVLKSLKMLTSSSVDGQTPISQLAVGVLVSFVVGLLALLWLLRMLEAGRFYWFAFWCIPLGILVLTWQFMAAWPVF